MDKRQFPEILDECIARMLGGATIDEIAAAFPSHASELRAALQGAQALLQTQAPVPASAARAAAMRQMLGVVEADGATLGSNRGGVAMGWLSWFKMRPPAARFAAAGMAAVIVGGLGMGAAAATGNAPEPVRSFFGVSSVIRVEFAGAIVSIGGTTLQIDANGDVRMVVVNGNTELSRGGDDILLGDLAPGDVVEVKGTLQADNSVVATRVHIEDDADVTVTPTPGVSATEAAPGAATATADDGHQGEDDGCDNSGPGSPCDGDDASETPDAEPTEDEGDGCDNSGPGSPCDDADEDVTETPGTEPTRDDADDRGHGGGDDDDPADDDGTPGGG